MAEKIVLAELNIDIDALLKSTSLLKKEIDNLKFSQKELTKAGDTSSEAFVQQSSDLKVLTTAYNQNIKAISAQTQATADLAVREELLNLTLQQEATSIAEAREQNKLLNKLRNETNVTTEEGKKQLTDLNNKLDTNNEFIKENADQYLKQKINIGNYSGALSTLSPQLSGLVTQLQSVYAGLIAQKDALIATSTTLGGTSKALNIFKLALISTGIGAIVVILGTLVTFLTSTQEGIDKVTAVTRPLQAIFQSLIGVLQGVGKNLFEAFSNPKKLLEDLADFVKTNLINRFNAFGVILDGIINLDFKKVADGVLQAGTGVENLTSKISNVANETGKFLDESIKKGQEIDRLTKEIEKSEINLNKEREISNTKIKDLDRILKDTSATFAERLKANEEQNRLAGITAQKEQAILNLKIERLKVQQSLNDTSREENKELSDLEAELERSKQRQIEEELKGVRVIAQARKDEVAKEKQRKQEIIDNALKENKALIDLFIAEQGFKAKTLEDAFIFEQELTAKRIALNQKEFELGKKSKTEFETEKLNISNDFLQKQAELTVDYARRELEAELEKSKSIIDVNKFLSEQILIEEKARINAIAEQKRQFEATRLAEGIINETQYNDAINAINKDNQIKLDEADLARKLAKEEQAKIDLENTRAVEDLIFQDNLAIQLQRLEQQRLLEVANAEKTGADVNKINQKYYLLDARLKQQTELAKVDATRNALQNIGNLLNDFGVKNKNLNIAFALADTYLSAIKAFGSQLVIGDPTSVPKANFAFGQALVLGLGNVAKIAKTDTKFEQGGIMEVGGNRHSNGGTKFVGSDGTKFEAERGELIGVLNRNASAQFMDFNNAFGQRGGVGISYAQSGGIIARGMDSQSGQLEQFAELTALAIQSIPAPIVTVEDINAGTSRVNVIESGATFG
jgi:hypothetical protein